MAEKKDKKPKEENQEAEVVHAFGKKEKKSPWTVDRCFKAAKRFDSVEAWAKGAPSSYKAADAHGWVEKCSGHMQGARKYQRTA